MVLIMEALRYRTFGHTWVRQRDRRNQGVGAQFMCSWGRYGSRLTHGRKGTWAQEARLLVLPVSLDALYLTLISTQYTDCLAVPMGAKQEL